MHGRLPAALRVAALTRAEVVRALERGGFVAAGEEADELLEAAAGDAERLAAMLARRLDGEPLAWIVGWTWFCGLRLRVDPGVYVPRPWTELVAQRALARMPAGGVAVDLCTGCGALGAVLAERASRVLGVDLDPRAVACAVRNGIEGVEGDLFGGVPAELRGRVDVVCGVVPYVPSGDLGFLQRDTFRFEDRLAYDGGEAGLGLLRRAVEGARDWLRPGGALVLELGGSQAGALDLAGYADVQVIADEDGDVRGVEATLA